LGVGVPQIIAGEIDVLPPDGGKVSKQRVRDDFPAAAEVIERTAEIHGVPEGDSGGDDREPARTILLRFGRTIAQPTEAMKVDSAGKGVARLALVELDGHLRRSAGSSNQSSMNSVRSIRPISRKANARPF